jgi:hypothetical protein
MKFSIEIDEEENMNHFESLVTDELARRLESTVNIKKIKQDAINKFEEKKNEELKSAKMQIYNWEKSSILLEMRQSLVPLLVKQVSEEVVKKLQSNSNFISEVSTEIIKSKFK